MKTIELTLVNDSKITFFVNHIRNIITDGTRTIINDGTHNNGGWQVQEKFEDIMKMPVYRK